MLNKISSLLLPARI